MRVWTNSDFLLAGGAEADVGAAGLEGFEVGAGGDFAVELLAGEPDLEVVGLGGGEAHVAGAEQHAAVGQAEEFEDALGVAGEALVLGVGLVGVVNLTSSTFWNWCWRIMPRTSLP